MGPISLSIFPYCVKWVVNAIFLLKMYISDCSDFNLSEITRCKNHPATNLVKICLAVGAFDDN